MKNTMTTIIFLTLLMTACGTQAPTLQATPVPATSTNTLPPPTETPVPPTDTQVPATDTQIPDAETPTIAASLGGVSFAKDVLPIFNATCNKCHGLEQVKEGLDMTTYDTLMAGSFNGLVITPGNSDDSYLVQQIVEGKMPKRGPGLTNEQIQTIVDWINQGAQNN